MDRTNIASVVSIIVVVCLVGVVVYQQLEISKLYGQNRELAVSNSQKDQEITNLRDGYEEQIHSLNVTYNERITNLNNNYNILNTSYSQTLSSLQQTTNVLESTTSNLTKLQQDYLDLIDSYNELQSSMSQIRSAIVDYSEELNGTSGVFVSSYSITYGETDYRGERDYILTVTFFNLLESCDVTLQFYNTNAPLIGHIHDFNFHLVSGRNDFVVGWRETVTEHEDYRLLVTRT